jgi:hypothetical protein
MELVHAGGIFDRIHQELCGSGIDFRALEPGEFAPETLDLARSMWLHRLQTEFRSIQVMTRFLTEVLGAGDPLEVYAGAADAIIDEIRHTALCMGVVEALGVVPQLPTPVAEEESPDFLSQPMAQRALCTAISMLAISETLSVGFIEDLARRCDHPIIGQVLQRTLADEDTHHAFGWTYVEASLERFSGGMALWRTVAQHTLEPHLQSEAAAMETLRPEQRHLDAWPEPDLARAGLLSREREALVFRRTYDQVLAPKLRRLGLI